MKTKSILLIYTGGTIGMHQNTNTGALENVDLGKILPLIPELQQLDLLIDVLKYEHPIDSSDMGPEQWKKLVKIIVKNYEKYDGFTILHGTDTMAYTASALSFMLEGLSKPVVFTGSQLPIERLRTDGRGNLITAIEIAATKRLDGSAMVPEVCIFFHDKLLRGNRTTKSSAEEFDAFRSFNYPPLAHAAIDINYNVEYIMPSLNPIPPLTPHLKMECGVMVVSLFPGIRKDILKSIFNTKGLKGVILRTFGSGNAPQKKWLTDLLIEQQERGIVIVNITQCYNGYVAMDRYGNGLQLMEAGVVGGLDSTVEAALTKMMRLFGDGLSPEKVKSMMKTSIAGEI